MTALEKINLAKADLGILLRRRFGLRQLRKRGCEPIKAGLAELCQVDVAKRLGRAHSFISTCELGERRVDFVELRQLAKIYDKDLSFFCE